jgi:hypothetical protein
VLRRPEQPATADELNKAALQFVRKISGFQKPSRANLEAFDRAVMEIAESSRRLLDRIEANPPRKRPEDVAATRSGSSTSA